MAQKLKHVFKPITNFSTKKYPPSRHVPYDKDISKVILSDLKKSMEICHNFNSICY